MRLKDNQFTLCLAVYSVLGWPILFLFADDLPILVAKALAISLFVSLITLIIVGNFVIRKKRGFETENVYGDRHKKILRFISILLTVILAAYAFIMFFLPMSFK